MLSDPLPVDPLHGAASGLARDIFLSSELLGERPFNVVLSLTPEIDEELGSLSSEEAALPFSSTERLQDALIILAPEDTILLQDALPEILPATPNTLLLPLRAPAEDERLRPKDDQGQEGVEKPQLQQAIGNNGPSRWLSLRLIWATVIVLALLFGLMVLFARSTTPAGSIAPDWGLASLRIGLTAALLCIPVIIAWLLLWRAHMQTVLARGGVFMLVLIVIGAAGLLSAAPLHRLQGQWFEAHGQYGLALNAYQLSGGTVATDQTMARIAVEWAEELSAQQQFGEAVTQLQPVVASTAIKGTLLTRADKDMIAAYLAWGDQAQQQQSFRVALTRYQTLGQASYCDAPCALRVHAASAQALLGLAQQLTVGAHYDQAVTTYEQLVNNYSDTSEGQAARAALSAPQSLKGRLTYPDMSPAANFQVLLASQWTFDPSTQVLKLAGQQYQAQTDGTGTFSLLSVAVGNTYMIAWVDTNGHSGTCITTNNQPLYTVHAQPLRATDVGTIDIECA